MKDWAKERWRKLYLREALDQRLWSVMARGLRDYLIRLAEDDGALIRDADDPVEALLLALGAHADEADLVRGAILLLRRDGFLSGSTRSMFVRNLPTAQTWEPRPSVPPDPEAPLRSAPARSSNERVRQFRERQRQAGNSAGPTLESAQTGTASTTPVTSSVTPSVSSPVTGVTSSVTAAVTSNVTSSRAYRKPKSSQSFLDLQIDKQPAHRPRSSCARGVTSSVTSPVTGVTPAVTSGISAPSGKEDDDHQLDFSWDSEEPAKASIRERALALRSQPTLADATHPEQWPEVVGVAQAFARAAGLPDPCLGVYGSDPGVRSILALYAAGFTQIEIERVAAFVPKQVWWRSKMLGLSSLSPEVVRRNLSAAMASELSPRLAKVLEDVKKRREAG